MIPVRVRFRCRSVSLLRGERGDNYRREIRTLRLMDRHRISQRHLVPFADAMFHYPVVEADRELLPDRINPLTDPHFFVELRPGLRSGQVQFFRAVPALRAMRRKPLFRASASSCWRRTRPSEVLPERSSSSPRSNRDSKSHQM